MPEEQPQEEAIDETMDSQKQMQAGAEQDFGFGKSIDQIFNLKSFHDRGYKGQGIKIAILDSGLGLDYQSKEMEEKMNIKDIIDFTKEDTGQSIHDEY